MGRTARENITKHKTEQKKNTKITNVKKKLNYKHAERIEKQQKMNNEQSTSQQPSGRRISFL